MSGRESLAHNMEGNKRSSMKRKESVRRIKAGVSRMINTLSRSKCKRRWKRCKFALSQTKRWHKLEQT